MTHTRMHGTALRRFALNLVVGTVAVGAAALLITPKVISLLDGSLEVLGVGAIANLALAFGGLMFLREAQRAYGGAVARSNEERKPTAPDSRASAER